MIRSGDATGDSAEYERVMRGLSQDAVAASPIVDALRHVLKRLGSPDDEAALDRAFDQFERENRLD